MALLGEVAATLSEGVLMSLPKKADKGYLEIADRGAGFAVRGHKDHTAELLVLFQQKGFHCNLQEAHTGDVQVVVFDAGADRARAKDILDAYKNAKGS